MFKASDIRNPVHRYHHCSNDIEGHSFVPYSTLTRKSELQDRESITALMCCKCLILVSIDDDLHQQLSHIAAECSALIG